MFRHPMNLDLPTASDLAGDESHGERVARLAREARVTLPNGWTKDKRHSHFGDCDGECGRNDRAHFLCWEKYRPNFTTNG